MAQTSGQGLEYECARRREERSRNDLALICNKLTVCFAQCRQMAKMQRRAAREERRNEPSWALLCV